MEEEKKEKKCKKSDLINELQKKIEEKEEEVLRAKADLINYRKRKDEEVQNMLKYSSSEIFIDLLPIIDNFERAISLDDNDLNDELSKFLEGFKMIYANLKEVLKKNEVCEIDCLGKVFDPNMETSVFSSSDPNYEDEIVVDVLQKGYMYKDKLLRSASVKINKLEKSNNEKEDDKNE